MNQKKNKITNKYINFDIPDKCKQCIDKCEVLILISEYEREPDPDIVDIYCYTNKKNE